MTDNTFRYLNTKILIMGGKESGKTTLVRDIYSQIQDQIDEVHVFSNVLSHYTDITNAIYEDFSLLDDLCLYCKTHHDSKKLVIIENILDHKQFDLLTDLLFNGKSYNVTLILTLQSPLPLKPEYRYIFEYVFASFYDFVSDQKKLYNYYFGMYPSFEGFMTIFSMLEQFDFMAMKVKSSPYVIKYRPHTNHQIRFISTKQLDKVHIQNIKSKNLEKRVDTLINELNQIKKEICEL